MLRPIAVTLALVMCLASEQALAQTPDTTKPAQPTPPRRPARRDPGLYIGVGFGFGGGPHQSDLAKALLNDEFSIKPSGHTTLLLRTGLSNIAQAEYRWTDGAHSFKNEYPPGGVLGDFESLPMDYDTKDWLLKLSPLAVVLPKHLALFAVGGRGSVEWRDESNDGFRGTTKLLGAEVAILSGGGAMHFGLLRSEITYDRATLAGRTAPTEIPATGWSLYFNLSGGPRLWGPKRR